LVSELRVTFARCPGVGVVAFSGLIFSRATAFSLVDVIVPPAVLGMSFERQVGE
jgi:hypothetical protein